MGGGEGQDRSQVFCPLGRKGEYGRKKKGGKGEIYRCAGLDVELADGGAVVHGVEGGYLVDPHRRHLEDAGHLVHDADAGEAMLALTQVEQRHHGRLLVLWRVALEDLGDDALVLLGELERDIGVVIGCVAMLRCFSGGT